MVEELVFKLCVHVYHVYKHIWEAAIRKNYRVNEKLETLTTDIYAIAVKKTARWLAIYRITRVLKILHSKYSRSHFTCSKFNYGYCSPFDLDSFRLLSICLLSFRLLSGFCVISPTQLKMPKNG